jgi:hypothetical protein
MTFLKQKLELELKLDYNFEGKSFRNEAIVLTNHYEYSLEHTYFRCF